jgi:hypothetical protein
MPAEAPIAPTNRKTASTERVGANAPPTMARANIVKPTTSGRRRPNLSDNVPCMICPTARPANHAAKVN